MKRALALCALLLLTACPAWAYRTLVTVPPSASNTDLLGSSNALREVRGWLERMGVQYDVVRGDALPTAQVAAGVVSFPGYTRTYDAVIVTDFTVGTTTYSSGLRVDSLTRIAAAWPSIPVLFIGSFRVVGVSLWAQTATCSTSIKYTLGGNFASEIGTGAGQARTAYAPGYPWRFKTWDGLCRLPLATGQNGTNRALIYHGISNASPNTNYESCTDCDGLVSAADSVVAWERIHPDTTTSGGRPTKGRLIFAWPNANGSTTSANFSEGVFGACVAHLDSVTGGRVIGSKAGWTPPKMGIFVARAGYHAAAASPSGSPDTGPGLLMAAGAADTATYKASLDSIGALRTWDGARVPVTVGYNFDTDTMATYPQELAWHTSRLPAARYTPMIYRGAIPGVSANASRYRPTDIFGRNRTRALVGDVLPYTPGTTDTSLYAQLYFTRARMDSIGLPLSNAIYPPRKDWVGSQFTRASLPSPDSLATALWYAGYRVLITSPADQDHTPSSTYMMDGSQTVYQVTDPTGLFPSSRRLNVYSRSDHSTRLGTFMFAATRGPFDADPASNNLTLTSGHWHADEFLYGFFSMTGPWYPADYRYYYHTFRTKLDVFRVDAGLLAGDSAGSNKRLAWWQLKSVVHQVNLINAMAGRTVIQIVDCGDL